MKCRISLLGCVIALLMLGSAPMCCAQRSGKALSRVVTSKRLDLKVKDLQKWRTFTQTSWFRLPLSHYPSKANLDLSIYRKFFSLQAARATAEIATKQALQNTASVRMTAFPAKGEVDAVIFDLDGTLLDSLWAWEHSGSNFVRSQGFEPPADLDEQLVKLSLIDGANLIKGMYALSYTPEEILELTLLPIKNRYFQEVEPMPGVPELLARLHAQGVKMAVATASYKEYAQAALERLGLSEYFEFIITCDEVGIGKTSPKVYEVAAQRLGTRKERTLVAEDALHALETAHKAGFKTAGIEEGHSAHQRAEKQAVSDYYVVSYEGKHTLRK